MTYKRKLYLRYYLYGTGIVWGIYLAVWLMGSFIVWDLANPFAWILDIPTMSDEARMSIMFGYLAVVGVKWLMINDKVKTILKKLKPEDVFDESILKLNK